MEIELQKKIDTDGLKYDIVVDGVVKATFKQKTYGHDPIEIATHEYHKVLSNLKEKQQVSETIIKTTI